MARHESSETGNCAGRLAPIVSRQPYSFYTRAHVRVHVNDLCVQPAQGYKAHCEIDGLETTAAHVVPLAWGYGVADQAPSNYPSTTSWWRIRSRTHRRTRRPRRDLDAGLGTLDA